MVEEPADPAASSSVHMAAASTAFPGSSPWLWATAALALCGGGAAAYTAALKKDEWEIEDMSPSV